MCRHWPGCAAWRSPRVCRRVMWVRAEPDPPATARERERDMSFIIIIMIRWPVCLWHHLGAVAAGGLRGQTLDPLAVQQRRPAAVFDVGGAGAAAVLTEEGTLWEHRRQSRPSLTGQSETSSSSSSSHTHRAGVAAHLHAAQLEPRPVRVQLRRPAEREAWWVTETHLNKWSSLHQIIYRNTASPVEKMSRWHRPLQESFLYTSLVIVCQQ